MTFDAIVDHIRAHFPKATIETDERAQPAAIVVHSVDLIPLMGFLRDDDSLYFDMLSCLSGIDNGADAGTMEVVYNLYSIPYAHAIMVRTLLSRTQPEIDSVASLYRTADWQEREAYDMLGIQFKSHPDLRRILMPNDWQGYPLRKDYKDQEKYHGMYVIHEDIRNPDKEDKT